MVKCQELISIIMPAYNAEKTLAQAVSSALAQTYKNFELLIIDDCSTDSTAALARSFCDPRIRLLRNDENSGGISTSMYAKINARAVNNPINAIAFERFFIKRPPTPPHPVHPLCFVPSP